MILFKASQYIQLKNPPEGVWGYFIKGYEYINGELYLISGDDNIKHHINDVEDRYVNYIMKEINNE
jgi:hypothetical protein